ncbi:MAG: hypothetical protein GY801_03975 [bacterium]|nr:hypothetical protein [bacterium]
MKNNFLVGIIAIVVLALLCGSPSMAEQFAPTFSFEQQIGKYPAPALDIAGGREMKFLVDPDKVGYYAEYGLKSTWRTLQAFARQEGIFIEQKEENPFKLTYSTKVYYDTPDNELAQQGYVVRITSKYSKGQPVSAKLTVKFIDRANLDNVVSSLEGADDAAYEENVSPSKDGLLTGYIEKAIKAKVDLDNIPQTLGEFGVLIPQLLNSGIQPDTELVGVGAYSVRLKPGFVNLPGLAKPAGISMEAWLPLNGGKKVFVYDFSFGYDIDNYYGMAKTHAAAEDVIVKIFKGLNSAIGMPGNAEYGGSKVSFLRKSGLDIPAYTGKPVGNLDKLYGILSLPSYLKYYEVGADEKVLLNPYLQVATDKHKAALDPEVEVYNYIINADGQVAIIQEARHPYGRKYEDGYIRPEDGKKKKPGSKEKYGHTSGVGGAVARIGGEILFEEEAGGWVINNKSGRYSKKNPDRTPRQLGFAAKLIQDTVDPGGAPWGPVRFRLAYTSPAISEPLLASPELMYLKPEKKGTPYILVTPAKSLEMRDYKVEGTVGSSGKAAFNDDPS